MKENKENKLEERMQDKKHRDGGKEKSMKERDEANVAVLI